MLNNDLISPLEVQNFRLKHQIEKFKKYDKERTEYYKKLVAKNAANEEYIKELEAATDPTVKKLREDIKHLKQVISELQKAIQRKNILLKERGIPEVDEAALDKIIKANALSKPSYLAENKKLKKQLALCRESISALAAKVAERENGLFLSYLFLIFTHHS